MNAYKQMLIIIIILINPNPALLPGPIKLARVSVTVRVCSDPVITVITYHRRTETFV